MQGKSVESTSFTWPGVWNPEKDFEKPSEKGVVGLGKVTKVRYHSVTSKSDVTRYIAISMNISVAFKRALHEKYGTELSYDYKKDTQNKIAPSNLVAAFGDCYSKLLKPLQPPPYEFWISADAMKINALTIGDEYEFKTRSNSIFLEKIIPTSMGNFSHMEGGEVMNQVSKVATSKQEDDPLPQDQMEGAASDECNNT